MVHLFHILVRVTYGITREKKTLLIQTCGVTILGYLNPSGSFYRLEEGCSKEFGDTFLV